MNFKKFISGVGALAIAASAFAGMAVTANAETNTLMEYGTADAAWTADGLDEWTAGGTPTLADGVVTISGGNGSYATSQTIAPTENAIINVEAVWRGRTDTGRAFSAGNGSYFRFGNIVVAQNDQDKKHGYGFAGLTNMGNVTTFTAGSYRTGIANMPWLKITMEINTATNTLTSFAVTNEDGTSTYASASDVALSGADYTTVAFGYQKGGSVGTTNTEQLKSIKITETTQDVITKDYAFNYYLGDVLIKSQNGTSVLGETVNATLPFTYDGVKYYAADGATTSITISETDADNSVNVPVRVANNYTVSLKRNIDDAVLASKSVVEGESSDAIYYGKYILNGTTLYSTPALSDSSRTYAYTFSNVVDNTDYTLQYTAVNGECVFFAEAEDLEGWSTVNDTARMSGGKGGYIAEESTVATLPAGKYIVTVGTRGENAKYTIKSGTTALISEGMNGYIKETSSEEFVITEDTDITAVVTGGSTTKGIDYIYIMKTGDITPDPSAEVTNTDATTYSGDEYDGEATSASVAVSYANMLADNVITLTYGEATKDVIGATGFTGNGNIVVGVVIENVADANPVFTAGVR